jgi:hypothetical protein
MAVVGLSADDTVGGGSRRSAVGDVAPPPAPAASLLSMVSRNALYQQMLSQFWALRRPNCRVASSMHFRVVRARMARARGFTM